MVIGPIVVFIMCRAVKASYALSFWEVIVHGEVGINVGGKKMIYLHLKKFFRGTRFTSQGFLRCLEKKHEEGDFVCVSGKVKAMGTPMTLIISFLFDLNVL